MPDLCPAVRILMGAALARLLLRPVPWQPGCNKCENVMGFKPWSFTYRDRASLLPQEANLIAVLW